MVCYNFICDYLFNSNEYVTKIIKNRPVYSNKMLWFKISLVPIKRHIFYTTSTSYKIFDREYLGLCPATSFSWTFDVRAGAVVDRNWFSVSEGIFLSVTDSVLTGLKRENWSL